MVETGVGEISVEKAFVERLKIEDGLKAYAMPDLRSYNQRSGEILPPTVNEAERKLNEVLQQISDQGGRLVAIANLTCLIGPDKNHRYGSMEMRPFLIVEKATNSIEQPVESNDHNMKAEDQKQFGTRRAEGQRNFIGGGWHPFMPGAILGMSYM
jgi:hypothetical protein